MKSDPAKLAGIREDQRTAVLIKNQVIVLAGAEAGFFSAQFASHAEMQAEPDRIGELKKHLFAMRLGAEEDGTRQHLFQSCRVRASKDSLGRVQFHCLDKSAQP